MSEYAWIRIQTWYDILYYHWHIYIYTFVCVFESSPGHTSVRTCQTIMETARFWYLGYLWASRKQKWYIMDLEAPWHHVRNPCGQTTEVRRCRPSAVAWRHFILNKWHGSSASLVPYYSWCVLMSLKVATCSNWFPCEFLDGPSIPPWYRFVPSSGYSCHGDFNIAAILGDWQNSPPAAFFVAARK